MKLNIKCCQHKHILNYSFIKLSIKWHQILKTPDGHTMLSIQSTYSATLVYTPGIVDPHAAPKEITPTIV